jgi:hypothetical protein
MEMMKLTTWYLLVCPLLGGMVLVWAMDPTSGLRGVVVFVVSTILHAVIVSLNSHLHWDKGLGDGMRLKEYRVQHTPELLPWDPDRSEERRGHYWSRGVETWP